MVNGLLPIALSSGGKWGIGSCKFAWKHLFLCLTERVRNDEGWGEEKGE